MGRLNRERLARIRAGEEEPMFPSAVERNALGVSREISLKETWGKIKMLNRKEAKVQAD